MVRRGEAPRPLGEESRVNMAIFSMRMQVIGRSAGRSATAAAAYRSGEEIKDERTGKSHDYTGKSDIYDSEILLPEGAPERLGDRVTLWNEIERVEKRKDAQLSREVMVALPAELTHEQKQTLTREYVRGEFTGQGMIADIGYHDFDSHNPHAHIMLTMRSVDEDGFGKKRREWNKRKALERQRKAWEEYANRALERAGYNERIDHRSLKEQGVEREPQIHLGAQVLEMEARGFQTRVGDESRRISKVNRDIGRREAQGETVRADIAAEEKSERSPGEAEVIDRGDHSAELRRVLSAESITDSDRLSELGGAGRAAESTNGRRPSMQVEGVAETILSGFDSFELEQYRAQLAEAQTSAPPDEKKQEPVKRQEQPKQRDKRSDRGMEL